MALPEMCNDARMEYRYLRRQARGRQPGRRYVALGSAFAIGIGIFILVDPASSGFGLAGPLVGHAVIVFWLWGRNGIHGARVRLTRVRRSPDRCRRWPGLPGRQQDQDEDHDDSLVLGHLVHGADLVPGELALCLRQSAHRSEGQTAVHGTSGAGRRCRRRGDRRGADCGASRPLIAASPWSFAGRGGP